MKRRVLLVSSVPLAAPWNGADKNLARLLATQDLDNIYIVQSDRSQPWPDGRIEVVRERTASPLPTETQKLRAMIFLMRQTRRADLIHIVASVRRPNILVGPFLRLWKRLSGKPLVHTAPSTGDDSVRSSHFPGDITVVVTEYDRRRLSAAGVSKVERIAPPLDLDTMAWRQNPQELAARLQLGERAVLYPGHYGPQGGVAECVEAFARLPAEAGDAVLVLACRVYPNQDPEEEAGRVRSLAAELGIEERIRLVGEVADMVALIAACTLTVLVPSRLEGKMAIPQVLLESLALGRPIITGSEAPINEALFGGGLSVQPGDVDALTDALARLLCDPDLRQRLGSAGRDAVLQQCAPEKAVQKYQEIYEGLSRRDG